MKKTLLIICFATKVACQLHAQGEPPIYSSSIPYTFITIAGTAGTTGHANGTGSAASFANPQGVAVDSSGNVFVADTDNNAIREITPAGGVSTFAGDPTAFSDGAGTNDGTGSAARFTRPQGLAIDSSNNLYTADEGNDTIREITPAAVVTTVAGMPQQPGLTDGTNSDARFYTPTDVAVDKAGNLYVTQYQPNIIYTNSASYDINLRKITPVGTNWVVTTVLQLIETNGEGNPIDYQPDSVAVDGAGNIYRGDDNYGEVSILDPDGNSLTNYGYIEYEDHDPFYAPDSLAVDGAGNIFVATLGGCTILEIPAGTPPIGQTVAVFLAGVWRSSDHEYAAQDGTGTNAIFNSPRGMALDAAGNLYVSDTLDNTIRKGFPASSVPPVILQSPGLNAGQFGFTIAGLPDLTVIVESSSDLSNWQAVSTNVLTGGTSPFSISQQSQTNQFYRARVP